MAAAKDAEAKRIGQLIANLRDQKAWSQEELAHEIEVSTSTISRWERGLHKGYGPNVRRLAEALEVEPAVLLPADDLIVGSQLDRMEAMMGDLYFKVTGERYAATTEEIVGQLPGRLAETNGSQSTEAPDQSENDDQDERRKSA